ncbi:c-type cytochrome [Lacibacterium aquatile]|uniref:C-type cytochrome n=1 Tax=Lacibacterium aquatile TaxID=1168082 RepID=A0ABW5DW58_9PROT
MATMGQKIAAALIAVGLLAGTGTALAQGDVIAQRKELMKANRSSLGAIKKIVDDGSDPAAAAAHAKTLLDDGQKFITLFPKGSESGDTASKPEVWSDWAGFEAANKVFTDAAQKVADASAAKDPAALKAAFGAVAGSCANCHNKFRK